MVMFTLDEDMLVNKPASQTKAMRKPTLAGVKMNWYLIPWTMYRNRSTAIRQIDNIEARLHVVILPETMLNHNWLHFVLPQPDSKNTLFKKYRS